MKKETKKLIHKLFERIENATERCSRGAYAHFVLAYECESETEVQHRGAVLSFGKLPKTAPDVETTAKWFCVKWFLEGFQDESNAVQPDDRQRPTITCEHVVNNRLGATLAIAVGAQLRFLMERGLLSIKLTAFTHEEIEAITEIDYAEEMNAQLARAQDGVL